MALIKSFIENSMERNSIHDEAEATFSFFERDGRRFIQFDSYGRSSREFPGKKSQTFQLDEASARQLADILKKNFKF